MVASDLGRGRDQEGERERRRGKSRGRGMGEDDDDDNNDGRRGIQIQRDWAGAGLGIGEGWVSTSWGGMAAKQDGPWRGTEYCTPQPSDLKRNPCRDAADEVGTWWWLQWLREV